jgi:uncharacterized protein
VHRLRVLLLVVLALPLCAFDVPPLTGPVVDRAGMLSAAAERQIASALQRLHQQPDGAQIAVLTVPDLGDETLEQASIQVVDAWQLGSEAGDKGILVMVAKAERRIRIEVGQGLEGDLPDAYAKRIIDEAMTPLFRSGSVEEGILVGVYQIAQRVHPNLDVAPLFRGGQRDWQTSHRTRRGGISLIPLLFLGLLLFAGRGRRGGLFAGMLLGSMVGRGYGGGGFGGGGGGFGGGGGGFSGGGASGGW